MDFQTAEKIVKFLENYNAHFTELFSFLTEKKCKVVDDDLCWLLESLVTEQKLIMRGNSLEAKRLVLFDELGVAGIHSAELIEQCPDELKGQMKLQVNAMEKTIGEIKMLNSEVLDLVDRKLSLQQEIVNKTSDASETYTGKGTKVQKHTGGIIGEV